MYTIYSSILLAISGWPKTYQRGHGPAGPVLATGLPLNKEKPENKVIHINRTRFVASVVQTG